MKKTSKFLGLALTASVLFFSSCQEDEAVDEITTTLENQDASRIQLSEEQKEFVANLKQSALVLTNVVTDQGLFQNIADRIEERPGIERRLAVNFSELFAGRSTESARTYPMFREEFNNTLTKGNYYQSDLYVSSSKNARSEMKELEKFLTDNEIQVYWPYKEDWNGKGLPTITYVPLDNEDVNEGFRLVKSGNGYDVEEVIVDDAYAFANPTWILRQHRPLPDNVLKAMKNSENNARVDGTARINEVRIAEVRCTKQLDGLFSKGETELYFVGAETAGNGQAITREIYVELSRSDVANDRWKTQNKIFDTNWTPSETVNAISVVDYDRNKKEQTISGSVTYAPKDSEGKSTGPSVTASYSVKIESEQRPLYSNGIHRDWFFERNWSDLGKGIRTGRGVWDADPVQFTLSVGEYN